MLSILDSILNYFILQEVGGREIAYDANNNLLLYVSPDSRRFGTGQSQPETSNQYFKVLNGPSYRKSSLISRVGFRNPQYEIHDPDNRQYPTVYLNDRTIKNMVNLFSKPYVVSNKAHEQREWAELLAQKNKQIEQYNAQTGERIPILPYFTNWQAAIMWTNKVNGFEHLNTVFNDSRILGNDGLNKYHLPFDLPIPEYSTGLPLSEDE